MAYTDWKGQAQDYGKVNFDFVLMTHIQDIGKQLQKLPHESILPNQSEPVGTTYDDIIKSYCHMVDHLESLLESYYDEAYSKGEICKTFQQAKDKFGKLMCLCSRKNFLFTRIRVKASGEDGV